MSLSEDLSMFDTRFTKRLSLTQTQGLYRNPVPVTARAGKFLQVGGREVINFSGNDYLGLGTSKRLKEKVAKNFQRYGTSSSSSRLVCGNFDVISEAEAAYGQYFGYESALFLPSGYQANVALISTLFQKGDALVYDKHIHASTVTGMRLSLAQGRGYNHNDMSHLAKRLSGTESNPTAVLTESLFSMDGDLLKVSEFKRLKDKNDFFAVVDEAHAFGALGKGGRGIAGSVADIAVGTFGKALGLFGAFVLLPAVAREYLFNFSPALIYSTTLPEAHAASTIDLLELVERSSGARRALRDISGIMREKLSNIGLPVGGDAHIITVQIGDEQSAVRISKGLLQQGIFVFSARYPTVPMGRAILRISMTAFHDEKDVSTLVDALKESLRRNGE
jgi:8-amino-7-oxononanoate synthase